LSVVDRYQMLTFFPGQLPAPVVSRCSVVASQWVEYESTSEALAWWYSPMQWKDVPWDGTKLSRLAGVFWNERHCFVQDMWCGGTSGYTVFGTVPTHQNRSGSRLQLEPIFCNSFTTTTPRTVAFWPGSTSKPCYCIRRCFTPTMYWSSDHIMTWSICRFIKFFPHLHLPLSDMFYDQYLLSYYPKPPTFAWNWPVFPSQSAKFVRIAKLTA